MTLLYRPLELQIGDLENWPVATCRPFVKLASRAFVEIRPHLQRLRLQILVLSHIEEVRPRLIKVCLGEILNTIIIMRTIRARRGSRGAEAPAQAAKEAQAPRRRIKGI